jgi:hypothetical protein
LHQTPGRRLTVLCKEHIADAHDGQGRLADMNDGAYLFIFQQGRQIKWHGGHQHHRDGLVHGGGDLLDQSAAGIGLALRNLAPKSR